MGNKFAKSVSFNTKNEEDQKILKHVKKKNFSGYAKKLMLEDIKRKELQKQQPIKSEGGSIVFKLEDTNVRK